MDVTGSVEMFVNRVARAMSPVRLTGNYGSEILRGNVAFKTTSWNDSLFAPGFAAQVKTAATKYTQERQVSRTSFIAFKQVPWFHYARMAVEASQLTVRSPYLDNELVAVAFQAPESPLVNQMLAHRYIADHNADLGRIPTDRGVVGHSGAPRSKFAVFRQEFMPRVEYVFDYGMPQWLAKVDRFMAPTHWERLFLGRQKFYHFRVWYRNELSGYLKEVLLDPRTLNRPYLNRGYVENIVNAHVTGRGNHTLELHKLLSSELIQRNLIEQA
jgi:asparagine synthase (glutamine-hydrolysing)